MVYHTSPIMMIISTIKHVLKKTNITKTNYKTVQSCIEVNDSGMIAQTFC